MPCQRAMVFGMACNQRLCCSMLKKLALGVLNFCKLAGRLLAGQVCSSGYVPQSQRIRSHFGKEAPLQIACPGLHHPWKSFSSRAVLTSDGKFVPEGGPVKG